MPLMLANLFTTVMTVLTAILLVFLVVTFVLLAYTTLRVLWRL